ncbi:MAG: helix-turn-helix transcriptional regulator [Bacteroidetes bacterium]|nr:helix-turn-helix transcriptional regulator [Bacteroidota bacterium]MDA1122297.1 helix-turn-helix transcriptional regulator [Bacteroidota bacterium]
MHKIRDEKVLKIFGENLRKVRKGKRLTLEALAFKSDIAFSSIVRIEQGQLNTTICTVIRLAGALEVKKSELFEF